MMEMRDIMRLLEGVGDPLQSAMFGLEQWIDDVLSSTSDLDNKYQLRDEISFAATKLIRERLE